MAMNPNVNYDSIIEKITNMSPRCKEYFDSEQYRINTPDEEIDIDYITSCLIDQLIIDLDEIGVQLLCNKDELFENWFVTKQLLDVFSYMLPMPLYAILKYKYDYQQIISGIAEGDLNDITDDPIENIIEYFEHNDMFDTLPDFLRGKIKTTNMFIVYLQKLLAEIDIDLPVQVDNEMLTKFTSIVNAYLTKLSDNINKIDKDFTSKLNMAKVLKDFRLHICNADKLAKYTWFFTVKPEGEIEQALHNKIYNELVMGCPLFIEYYKLRGLDNDMYGLGAVLLAAPVFYKDTYKEVFLKVEEFFGVNSSIYKNSLYKSIITNLG